MTGVELAMNTWAIIEVMVVLPWLPATAIVVRFCVNKPKHSERFNRLIDLRWMACKNTGLSLLIAGVYTTKSTPAGIISSNVYPIRAPLASKC